jgi:hypothetical protein
LAGAQAVTRIYFETLEKPEPSTVGLRETLVAAVGKGKAVTVVPRLEEADRVLAMSGETYIKDMSDIIYAYVI